MTNQKFKSTAEAHAIRRGKMWVSQIDEPPCGISSAAGRGNVLVFAGCDHLTLNVAEARALRDWLESVLPDEPDARFNPAPGPQHEFMASSPPEPLWPGGRR